MIDLTIGQPLHEAVASLSRRTPLGAMLSSAEWELLEAEIRMRAFFSATVEDERILGIMQEKLRAGLAMEKTTPEGGRAPVTMDRNRFIAEMREELRKAGYKRGDAKSGGLRDLKSNRRLGLIWDMNRAQARGYATWLAGMSKGALSAVPALEFKRVANRMERRDWPRRWRMLGGEFFPGPSDYPEGRMIALKTDDIWVRLNRFGVPWAPFDWGSGMGLRGVPGEEAEEIGLITEDDPPLIPLAMPFNTGVRMSAREIPEAGRENLRSAMGDAIRFDGDDILLQPGSTPEDHETRNQHAADWLRERARRHYLQASERLDRLEGPDPRGDVRTSPPLGVEAEEVARVQIAQASAVAVGRKRLFHDTMPEEDAERLLDAIQDFPDTVAAHYEDGHLLIWREDMEALDPRQVIQQIDNGGGGKLLGYGRETMGFGEPHVQVWIWAKPRKEGDMPVVGFHAPVSGWRAFARARAKDIEDAWGVETETEWEVRP